MVLTGAAVPSTKWARLVLAVVAAMSPAVFHAQTPPPAAPATDIWPARDVSIPADPRSPRIRIGIWDSGIDTTLFPGKLSRDGSGKLLLRGYDAFKNRQDVPLEILPASMLARKAELDEATLALDDMDTFVQSPGAKAMQERMAKMTPAERAAGAEDLERWTGYAHGTGVADIALAGNERAEAVLARMEWWHGSPPVPCWSRELANKEAASIADLLKFLVDGGARVVNMSWGRYERSYQNNLQKCAPQLSAEERNAIARYSVDTIRAVLTAGMNASPQVLFVGAAGNQGQSVAQSNPATKLDLPNFMLIGAVNRSGMLPAFTNFGPEVHLFANGWRVPARMPGGTMSYQTGTSMATPQVANAAAKMLAVNPKLSGADLRRLLLQTADTNSKGLKLLHTARAVEAARAAAGNR